MTGVVIIKTLDLAKKGLAWAWNLNVWSSIDICLISDTQQLHFDLQVTWIKYHAGITVTKTEEIT